MIDYAPGQIIPMEQYQKDQRAENEARGQAGFKWVLGVTDLYECHECAALVAGAGWRGHAKWHEEMAFAMSVLSSRMEGCRA